MHFFYNTLKISNLYFLYFSSIFVVFSRNASKKPLSGGKELLRTYKYY